MQLIKDYIERQRVKSAQKEFKNRIENILSLIQTDKTLKEQLQLIQEVNKQFSSILENRQNKAVEDLKYIQEYLK